MNEQVKKFKAEIDAVKLIIQANRAQGAFSEGYLIGQESVLEHFEKFVNSMQEEQIARSSTKATDKEEPSIPDIVDEHFYEMLGGDRANEGLDKATVEYAATGEFLANGKEMISFGKERAFRAGANWLRKQLMKRAVERVVHIDAGGYPYIGGVELWDYDKDEPLAKRGDKVKVIIIKNE